MYVCATLTTVNICSMTLPEEQAKRSQFRWSQFHGSAIDASRNFNQRFSTSRWSRASLLNTAKGTYLEPKGLCVAN